MRWKDDGWGKKIIECLKKIGEKGVCKLKGRRRKGGVIEEGEREEKVGSGKRGKVIEEKNGKGRN